ncbi:MAG: glycosyltransferase family 4 protein [Nitrosomonadales bacterium]|nr:glycosyltransferase family 4 protein [Nitrosomonadales bacterium]
MKIFMICNTAWGLVNFRSGLMLGLIAAGHEVVAVAPPDDHVARIEALGIRFLPMPMDNKGTHPGRDLLLLLRFYRVFRRERPGLIINYTIKPVIYASLAARYARIPAISVVTGLGVVFLNENWVTRLVEVLYRYSQSRVQKLFFLNRDDMQFFQRHNLAPAANMECLPGEGVDLAHFSPNLQTLSPHSPSRPFRFLLLARMLWDKGVGEYVEAARQVRRHYPDAEFCLLGFLDVQNPAAISREQMAEWVAAGTVNYLGATDDVRPHIASADCVVLPSYREGIPRTLLEAAAMVRPIITTDAVGCRDVVDDGVNGWLCKPRDATDLADKMTRMIALPPEARTEMGLQGRSKVEREFDERVVIKRYLDEIGRIAGQHPT